MVKFDDIRSAIAEIQRDNEYGIAIKKRDDRTKALWLGIHCIEAYNDDMEETERCIRILQDIILEQ